VSVKRLSMQNSTGFSALMSLMRLHPLVPPRLPSWSEVASTGGASAASSVEPGLFSSLIGNPLVLLEDYLREPSKYEESTEQLLQELAAGTKTLDVLSSEEMSVLDRATLDYNRKLPAKTAAAPAPSKKEADDESSSEDDAFEEQMPADLMPAHDLVPDWFR
jgi:hypothetical protein